MVTISEAAINKAYCDELNSAMVRYQETYTNKNSDDILLVGDIVHYYNDPEGVNTKIVNIVFPYQAGNIKEDISTANVVMMRLNARKGEPVYYHISVPSLLANIAFSDGIKVYTKVKEESK